MTAYYNEVDPYAAQWLRNLIDAGHIATGDVDERSIQDVRPADLDGYTQCHFFAGIGIWSKALRSAGWSDDRPVWTGSCPCQPFSAAGAKVGFDDERHLWPDWHWLIEQCRPETVFGEQVASADGLVWADLVSSDLEATDYAFGPVDTCAAGFRSFHIRQRLYFAAYDIRSAAGGMADTDNAGLEGRGQLRSERADERLIGASGVASGLAHSDGWHPSPEWKQRRREQRLQPRRGGSGIGLADASSEHLRRGSRQGNGAADPAQIGARQRERSRPDNSGCGADVRADPSDGYWRDADWLWCRDGVWRPAQPGTFPLAHQAPSRMGRLRAYGNGLDLAQATGFVRAYLERGHHTAHAGDLFEWGVEG